MKMVNVTMKRTVHTFGIILNYVFIGSLLGLIILGGLISAKYGNTEEGSYAFMGLLSYMPIIGLSAVFCGAYNLYAIMKWDEISTKDRIIIAINSSIIAIALLFMYWDGSF